MKTGIILKDRIFIPDYDSHTDMLKELGIEDTRKNAERLFVRAELLPLNGDVFSPVENWKFNIDQDIRPDWFVEDYEKERMIKAIKEWAKDRIHIEIDGLKISSGANHYIKDCKNVEVCGSASISEAKGQAIIANSPYTQWKKQNALILSENSTFKDNIAKVIYQSGKWEMRDAASLRQEE